MKRTRSWLFTPATRPERFCKAAELGADVLIIDLEDAVAPSDKEQARKQAFDWLADHRPERCAHALRINRIDSLHGLADVMELLTRRVPLDFLILPKTEGPDQITVVDRLLASTGISLRIVALIESARGLRAVDQIALSSPRLSALMFGAADMSADLGCAGQWDALLYARSKVIAASALAGLAVIDSPFFEVRNLVALNHELALARSLGFTAKAAIHPGQVSPINESFAPDARDVQQARLIVEQVENGVGIINGQMIDEAMARKARRVIAASLEE